MPDYENLRLENQLCFALYAATNAVTRTYRKRLGEVGLTYSQYLVMLALWEFGTQSVGALGNRLGLDSGTLTPLLQRLERNGFLTRRRRPEDERVVEVRLSRAGGDLRKEVSKIQETVACRTGLSNAEFSELKSALHRLAETMRTDEADQAA